MMTEATQAATGRLIEANRRRAKTRDADESQRFVRQSIHQETGQLEDQFWEATTRARTASRNLAQGQVASELAIVEAYGRAKGFSWTIPAVPKVWEATQVDELSATIATGSAVSQWASAMMLGTSLWGRNGGRLEEALKQSGSTLTSKLVGHASYQAFEAYGHEHRNLWGEIADLRDDSPRNTRPRTDEVTDSDIGLPWGWTAMTYKVWTAFLDGRTCSVCWGLDAQMVPFWQPFDDDAQVPLHNRCRCAVVTMVIPEAMRRRLPGLQIDYGQIKDELQELIGARGANNRMTREARNALAATNPASILNIQDRSALRYIRAVTQGPQGIRAGIRQSSPEALLKRLNEMQRRPIGNTRTFRSSAGTRPPRLYPPPGPRDGQ
jgi:hypothetical protein